MTPGATVHSNEVKHNNEGTDLLCRAAGHTALGRELMWSQAALMRVSWQVLAQEESAASEGPTSAPLATPARALQRLLWCHAHHNLAFPVQASHMVADMLVPRLHNLTGDEVWASVSLMLPSCVWNASY
jgi:hypothetical protein